MDVWSPLTLRARLIAAVKWRVGSQVVVQLISWGCTLFVIRLLQPSDYGLMAMTQSVGSLLAMLSGDGMSTAIIQKRDISKEELQQTFGFLILINGALFAFQILAAPFVASYYKNDVLVELLCVQAITFLFVPVIIIEVAVAKRQLDFKSPAIGNIWAILVSGVVTLWMAFAGLGVWALIGGQIALQLTRVVVLRLKSTMPLTPRFQLRGLRGIASFGGTLMLTALVWFLYSQADIIIAGRLLGAHELGVYTTALFIAQIAATKILPALLDVGGSAFAQIQHDRPAVVRQFLRLVSFVSFATMPIYAGLFLTASDFVLVVMGEKWSDAIDLLRLLAVGMPLLTLSYLFAPVTNALGKPQTGLYCALVCVILLPPAFWIGVNEFGLRGLAYVWIAIFPICALNCAYVSCKVIGVRLRDLAVALTPGIVCSALMGGVVWAGHDLLGHESPAMRLMFDSVIGVTVYLGFAFLLFRRQFEHALGKS